MTDHRYECYESSYRPRDNYASTVHGRTCSNDDDHNRDHRREPRQANHPKVSQGSKNSVVFDREAHRWCQENRVRKMLERCGKELGQTTHWRNPSKITMVLRCFQDHHTLQKREGRASATHSGRAPSA